ncbi:MAG: sigma-70 family RNA polymerase sigma factor [Pirellulaceae bacterium]
MPAHQHWPSTRISLLAGVENTNSQSSWNDLVAIYAPLVFRFAMRKGLSAEDAEEVAQDVLVKITRFHYEPEKGKFRSWLARVTARQIRDQMQKNVNQKRISGSDDFELSNSPSITMGEWEEIYFGRILQIAIRNIRNEFEQAEWNVWEAGQSARDVDLRDLAKSLGKSIGWVYKVRHSINQRLRSELVRLGEDMPVQ